MIRLYYFLLCVAAVQLTQAAPSVQVSSEALSVWLYATDTPELTQTKAGPFFESVNTRSGLAFNITASKDTAVLLNNCQAGPDVVLANINFGLQLKTDCQYEVLARSRNTVSLFSKYSKDIKALGVSPTVAYVESSSATTFARNELSRQLSDVSYKRFDSAYSMIRALVRGEVSAFVARQDILNFGSVNKAWYIIHDFEQTQEEWVMASPRLADKNKDIIHTAFVSNNAIVQSVWGDGFGYGTFVTP